MSQAGMLGVLYLTIILDKTNNIIHICLHDKVALPQHVMIYHVIHRLLLFALRIGQEFP